MLEEENQRAELRTAVQGKDEGQKACRLFALHLSLDRKNSNKFFIIS